jgi:Flp pilus assembly protein TadD
MKRFIILCVLFTMTLLLATCSKSPDERAIKHMRRGDEYTRNGQFKEAVIEYKNAVDALPDNPDLRWKLSRAALKANDFGTAFGELRRVVNPHYAAILSNSLLC